MYIEVGELTCGRLIGRGAFAMIYEGLYRNSLRVAVKRIQKDPYSNVSGLYDTQLQLLQVAQHPNILRYFCSEENDDFLYIAMERCIGTLEDYFSDNCYRGPIFIDEREMLHQLTKGVAYLHGRHIIHRDINPTNILIYLADTYSSLPQIKLNIPIRGKTWRKHNEDFTNTSYVTNPKGTRGWMAPELYQSVRVDSKVDIWALGCVFAYSLTRGGKHPFHDDTDMRIALIRNKQPMRLTIEDLKRPYCDDRSTFELIQCMLETESSNRPTADTVLCHVFFKRDSQFSYDKKKIIGEGKFSIVFHGLYSGFPPAIPVAVKRKEKLPGWNDSDFDKQLQLLQVVQHPNILRCFGGKMDNDFTFTATELCNGNLRDYIEGRYHGPPFKDEKEMLHQLTKGVTYLHEKGIVHRDIKPTNVLIFYGSIRTQIKLDIPTNGKMIAREDYTNASVANPHEAREQLAPEMSDSERFDFKEDIRELGCVFVYTLSGGKHPFDDPIEKNISPLIEDLKKPYCDDLTALELVQSMLKVESSKQPSAEEVLNNFFFEGLNDEAISKAPTPVLKKVDHHLIYYFSKKYVLGQGNGTFVLLGIWKDHLLGKSDVKFQKVAVKRFQIDPSKESKFDKEVGHLTKFKGHPNILQLFTTEKDDNFWYIVTELCHGTLESWLKNNYQGPPIRDERNILFQVTKGLAFVHDKGIAHRDIKPSNILIYIPEVGEPLMKLADFGISSNITAEEGFTNTDKDEPMGTRSFIPPEMYQFDRCDLRVDIYGLGVVFGQVLSKDRKKPFDKTICDEGSTMILKLEDFKPPYSNNLFAFNLIKSMGNVKPEERPTAQQILINIFFS